MIHDMLFSFWFFVPAGIGNSTPIIAAHAPGLRAWNAPMDFGKSFRKNRIFGAHKTLRGLLCGMIMGVFAVWLQSVLFHHYAWARQVSSPVSYEHLSVLTLGLLLSFGALMGDAIESFLKRQFSIDSGQRWFPFDQLDFVIGSLLLTTIYVRLPLQDYLWIILIWFGMHLLFSYLGYLLKLKDQPI